MYIYIYILHAYIYKEREREMCVYVYIYIHTIHNRMLSDVGSKPELLLEVLLLLKVFEILGRRTSDPLLIKTHDMLIIMIIMYDMFNYNLMNV